MHSLHKEVHFKPVSLKSKAHPHSQGLLSFNEKKEALHGNEDAKSTVIVM
jgi:hypothetical protein